MKTYTFLLAIIFVIMSVTPSHAQTPQGPFDALISHISQDIESSNIFLLWQQDVPGSGLHAFQKVYRYGIGADAGVPVNQKLSSIHAKQDGRPVAGNRHMVVSSGNFVVSPFDYAVAAWEGQNRTIELMIPHFDTTDVMWNSHTAFTVDGPVAPVDGNNERGRIFIETGDMTANGLDEFALVFHGADSTIHVQLYSVDENLEPQLMAAINDEQLLPTPTDFTRLSVATGDINGDGREDVIISSATKTGSKS
ncbi:MAG: hypothetical protein ACNA8K_04790 [Cyclonatronaceae bacterium]